MARHRPGYTPYSHISTRGRRLIINDAGAHLSSQSPSLPLPATGQVSETPALQHPVVDGQLPRSPSSAFSSDSSEDEDPVATSDLAQPSPSKKGKERETPRILFSFTSAKQPQPSTPPTSSSATTPLAAGITSGTAPPAAGTMSGTAPPAAGTTSGTAPSPILSSNIPPVANTALPSNTSPLTNPIAPPPSVSDMQALFAQIQIGIVSAITSALGAMYPSAQVGQPPSIYPPLSAIPIALSSPPPVSLPTASSSSVPLPTASSSSAPLPVASSSSTPQPSSSLQRKKKRVHNPCNVSSIICTLVHRLMPHNRQLQGSYSRNITASRRPSKSSPFPPQIWPTFLPFKTALLIM